MPMTGLCRYRLFSVPPILAGGLGCLMLLFSFTSCTPSGVYHHVQSGQTLYSISKIYRQNETYLARINGISDPTQLKTGTRLFIPGATRQLNVPATVKSAPVTRVRPAAPPKPAAQPQQKKTTTNKKTPQPVAAPKVRSSKPHSTKNTLQLRWPLRGKILRAFGDTRQSGGNGIEIATPVGTSVLAAAAGKVIYSGDGVQGFGHLIILQHENDFFTVYGYNSRLFARTGQFVSRGQKIAESGLSPAGAPGRLHFEVRSGKQPVNPILYLP